MKKLFVLILALTIVVGCGKVPESKNFNNKVLEPNVYGGDSVFVFTDEKTGCDYFIYAAGYKGGITARLTPDGLPYCNKSK